MTCFVSVGNLKKPFNRLLLAVRDNVALLPAPVVVQHGHTPFSGAGCQAVEFLKMEDFQRLVAEADLVILHGGAGSIITALQAGKKPIVMARRAQFGEHIDDHQQDLVSELADAGRILVAHDGASLALAIEPALLASRSPVALRPTRDVTLAKLIRSDLEAWALTAKGSH